MTTASPGSVGSGQLFPWGSTSHFNVLSFIIDQALGVVRTVMPVSVVAVTGGGAGNPPGTVDVQPLVNQLDGSGNSTPHGVVPNRPWLRSMGGNGAVISDPVVGDVGLLLVCDRDVSAVVSSGAQANPGSYREFDLSDGFYLGAWGGDAPTQYVLFTSSGITIADKSGNTIVLNSAGITATDVSGNVIATSSTGISLTGSVMIMGNLDVTGSVVGGFGGADQVGLTTHEHPTAATGSPSPPTPGT